MNRLAFETLGDWVIEFVGGCTCGAGQPPYGHEPGCGWEPVGQLGDEFNGAVMWDFSDADRLWDPEPARATLTVDPWVLGGPF